MSSVRWNSASIRIDAGPVVTTLAIIGRGKSTVQKRGSKRWIQSPSWPLRLLASQNVIVGLLVLFRHPELVSGSTSPPELSGRNEKWMLKQVQHDEGGDGPVSLPVRAVPNSRPAVLTGAA